MGAAERFAIQGDNLPIADGGSSLDPGQKALLKLLGVGGSKDPPEGVVGRNAVGQRQEGMQPGLFGVAERLNVDAAIAAQMTAQTAITMISSNACCLVRSRRGSSSAAKCVDRLPRGRWSIMVLI